MQGGRATSEGRGPRPGPPPRPGLGPVRRVAETGSTNADLLAEARAGAPAGLVLVADHQTAGRGRAGRSWTAPPGASLLLSVLVRPPLAPDQAHLVASALGVAAVAACREVAGVGAALKWPNDVVVPGPGGALAGKLGGILAEAVVAGDRLEAVVAGLGLNVAWGGTRPPEGAGLPGVALDALAGAEVDRGALLDALLADLARWCDGLGTTRGRAALARRHREVCATIGAPVRVVSPTGAFEGTALGLTPGGHLLVEDAAGTTHEVVAADVTHLRHQR